MDPIVELDHLYFEYSTTPVLRDITFRIETGEFVGVIGPNGGGKTTLLKLLMGFLKPASGKIQVLGGPPPAKAGQLAYVPQSIRFDRLFPISVMELVLSGRLSRLPWHGCFSEQDHQAALNALKQVGLENYQNHSFGTLSGGQAQRALIARALVSEPKLLLLDEPTASVDPQAEADIYQILKGLQGSITIIMVTHDLRAAINQVERVICVQGSAFCLKPEEVCNHFAMGLYHPPLINPQTKGKS